MIFCFVNSDLKKIGIDLQSIIIIIIVLIFYFIYFYKHTGQGMGFIQYN